MEPVSKSEAEQAGPNLQLRCCVAAMDRGHDPGASFFGKSVRHHRLTGFVAFEIYEAFTTRYVYFARRLTGVGRKHQHRSKVKDGELKLG